jgi:murein DD-endopeptidase MepM/ murein hydrolase activator NlpD
VRRPSLRRALPWLVALVLVVPLVGGVATPPTPAHGDDLAAAISRQKEIASRIAAQKAEIARLNAQQASLNGAISDTNNALTTVNANLTDVRTKIASLGDQIAQVKATYQDLVAQLAQLDSDLADIQQLEVEKQQELSQRKAILAGRLRAAYQTDRTSLLETILSSGSFADAMTTLGYLVDFGDQDKQLAIQIQQDQQTLATIDQTVSDTRAQTEDLRVETADQKRQLDARLGAQTAAKQRLAGLQAETTRQLAIQKANYAKLARNKAAAQKAMEYSVAAEKALQRQIASIIARQRRLGNIPSRYNGTLTWPMSGSVTQEFGCTGVVWEPPQGSCRHYHNGIDLAGPMYTPVRASGDGRVVFAGPNPYDPYPKAWIVIVAHSGELQTWYAHLDNGSHSIPVSAGQWVTKGQIIGYEGMTGRTTGPHLHFMVELNGSFVNPRYFM